MTARCPSDLALEAHLLEPERSPLRPHLEACPACQGRLARMRAEGDEFRQFVFPATVEKVEEAAAPRRPLRLGLILGPIGAFAGLAAALLLFVKLQQSPAGPDAGYVGLKGGGVGLAVYVNDPAGPRALEDGAPVPATAALRFQVSPASDCYLWIMSVDARGAVSRIYPPKGESPRKHAPGPVPGGAVLDGGGGPERIFAVCAPETMAWNEVRSSALPFAASEASVRSARGLAGPLSKAAQSSILLEKNP